MVTLQLFSGRSFKNFKEAKKIIPVIKYLQFDRVWCTPHWESPSYHKYDTSNHFTVDKDLGNIRDFTKFINELRRNNIRFMMDLIVTHVSAQHTWFIKSAHGDKNYLDYFHWSDFEGDSIKLENCHDQSVKDKWYYCDINDKYYYAPFGKELPALNLSSVAVKHELEMIVAYWIGIGVDDFRLDAVKHSHELEGENAAIEFWNWFRKMVKNIKPDTNLVGECWPGEMEIARYSNAIGSCFNFPMQSRIVNDVRNKNEINDLSWKIKNNADRMKWASHIPAYFLTNHDMNSLACDLGEMTTINSIRNSLSVLYSLKGDIYIYYSTLFNHYDTKEFGDEFVRPEYSIEDWDRLYYSNICNFLRDLGIMRKYHLAMEYGNFIPVWQDDSNLYIVRRKFFNDEFIFVHNFGTEIVDLTTLFFNLNVETAEKDLKLFPNDFFYSKIL